MFANVHFSFTISLSTDTSSMFLDFLFRKTKKKKRDERGVHAPESGLPLKTNQPESIETD
jgi:hypothetical protein